MVAEWSLVSAVGAWGALSSPLAAALAALLGQRCSVSMQPAQPLCQPDVSPRCLHARGGGAGLLACSPASHPARGLGGCLGCLQVTESPARPARPAVAGRGRRARRRAASSPGGPWRG